MTEIRIERALIEGISCLIISGDLHEPAPLVLFIHGIASDKRQGIPMGYELAKKGFIYVSIDAIQKGERVGQEFDPLAGPNFQSVYPEDSGLDNFINMFKIVRQSGLDIQTLIEYFKDDSRIDVGNVGLVGYSMGGFAAFYAVRAVPAVKAVVSIAAAPCFEQRWLDVILESSTNPEWESEIAKVESETARRTAFIQEMDPYPIMVDDFPTPLLLICGDVDSVSPKKYLLDLYQKISKAHDHTNLKLSIYDGIDHQLTLAMAEETANWLGAIFEV